MKDQGTVVLVGTESAGKTQLVRSLTGRSGESARFRGTTLACETYRFGETTFIDSPGILRSSDSETTRAALASLEEPDSTILLTLHASHLDSQIPELWPLLVGRHGIIVLSHWDQVQDLPDAIDVLAQLRKDTHVPVIPLDCRTLSEGQAEEVFKSLAEPGHFAADVPQATALRDPPKKDLFQLPLVGPLLALFLLFAPAWFAVTWANSFADSFYEPLNNALGPFLGLFDSWHPWLQALLTGDYGVFAMFPFLILYALPTVLVFALFLSLLKTSGLVDRLTVSLESALRPFGLSGRDLVRVVMGFGCNVPAVINTRACASCSRGAAVHAISFGSACSYQLPATLAVFAAVGMTALAPIFLVYLGLTTLLYVRFTTPKVLRDSLNTLQLPTYNPVHFPSFRSIIREAWETLKEFLRLALPVFIVICFVAAIFQLSGALDALSVITAPLMALFNLPGEVAPAVILGSIRKDGLAIALLDSDWEALKVPLKTQAQVLTAVYLAGVLLPCLVTLGTIAREFNPRYALKLCAKQVAAATLFSLVLAWGFVWMG